MKNKNLNGKMHLEIQTHRKNPIGLIRSTYREDSKVKHQTLSRMKARYNTTKECRKSVKPMNKV